MDENLDRYARFGGHAATNLNPLGLIWLIVAVLSILLLPRKHIVVPFFLTIFLIPLGQALIVAGANFLIYRILVIAGLCRMFFSLISGQSTVQGMRFNAIDKAFIWFGVSSVITFTLLFGEVQAFVNHMGFALDSLGTYFLLRLTLRDEEDVDRVIKIFAILCTVIAVFMLNEQLTGHNLFSMFGGVPQLTVIREGALRSQGPFMHAILAGTFGAIMFPLFVGLWWKRKNRTMALLGILSAVSIITTSHSSTPLAAGLAALVALGLWPFRRRMRLLRWGIVLSLVGLHIVMKAPVWALIARTDVVGGSSGYHRYMLVDNFIRRFGEWWLVGVRDTAHWGYDMWDVSNQYVATGVSGGLITFILLIAVIVYCFKALGRAREEAEDDGNSDRAKGLWALGAALTANLMAFIGTTYFDQTQIAWYSLLAMISTLTISCGSTRLSQEAASHHSEVLPTPALDRAYVKN